MNNILQGSLVWRFLQRAAAAWKASGLHRMNVFLHNTACRSCTAQLLRRFFGRPARQAENSRAAVLLRRGNGWLWRLGRRCVPVLEQSLLCRAVRAVFRCGRESRLLGRLFRGGICGVLLAVLASYGIVDYVLRDLLHIPLVSSLWDEALMVLCLLWLAWDRMRPAQPMLSRANPMDSALILFLGVGLALMFLVSPYFTIALQGYRATVQYMLWFFIMTRLLRDDQDLMTVYLIMVGFAFLIALHGIYQYIVAVPIPSHWTDQAEQSVRTRVFSIFGSPNIMGDFMVMFAPMTAGLAYWARRPRVKALLWFATFCMCFSCLFTMSRGAWVAMVAAILIFAILVDRRLLALMGIAGLAALAIPFVASRIGYLFSEDFLASTNNGGRGSRWFLAMSYLELNPVFGFGLGMFGGAVAMQYKILPWISYFYVDNYYLKILVEMGWVGLTAFILLMLCLIGTGLRCFARATRDREGRSLRPLCAGMLSGLCGVLVHCFFENIFEEPYMMAYFWSIAAMLVYIGFLRKGRAAP